MNNKEKYWLVKLAFNKRAYGVWDEDHFNERWDPNYHGYGGGQGDLKNFERDYPSLVSSIQNYSDAMGKHNPNFKLRFSPHKYHKNTKGEVEEWDTSETLMKLEEMKEAISQAQEEGREYDFDREGADKYPWFFGVSSQADESGKRAPLDYDKMPDYGDVMSQAYPDYDAELDENPEEKEEEEE